MGALTVRRAVEGDFEEWLALFEEVAAEGRWIGAEAPVDRERARRVFDARLDFERAATFVAESEGVIVGHLGVYLGGGVADLGMMVRESDRGRGVGSRLLETCIEWSRERGAHKVTLSVWPHNERALRLYRSHGFVIEGRLRRQWRRRNGELWDAVLMGLVLDTTSPDGVHVQAGSSTSAPVRRRERELGVDNDQPLSTAALDAVGIFENRVLPSLADHGRPALVYAQGSLISGYTDRADLDLVVVWDGNVPTARGSWLSALQDAGMGAAFSYDADPFFLDRLVCSGQELNLAHFTVDSFESALAGDALGVTVASNRACQQIRSGLLRGRVLADDGRAEGLRAAVRHLPEGYVEETCRVASNTWAYAATEARKAAARKDWLVLSTTRDEGVQAQLVAVFALAGQYYPGLKWVRKAMPRAHVDERAQVLYDAVWAARGEVDMGVGAVDDLADWVRSRAPDGTGVK